ncbi:MAG: TolC family protein [Desulfovibrio sp.]|nr:MAG: TolC family protein [Desulfovibrio sp.]
MLLAVVGTTAANAAEELDMGRSVQTALENSPRMESSRAQIDAAEDGTNAALAEFFPTATATYSYTRNDHPKPDRDQPRSTWSNETQTSTITQYDDDIYTLKFNVTQTLFTGFRLLSSYQKALLNEEKVAASQANEELSLMLAVQESFLNLLKARESVRSAEDSHARLTSQLMVTQAFYDVGLKPRLDVLQAEVNLANAEDTLLQAENSVATTQARLDTLLVLEPGQADYVGELAYVPFTMSLDDCLVEAYQNRPDMVVMRKGVEIASEDVTIAASGLYPQVSASFDWSSTGNDMAVRGQEYDRTEFSEWSFTLSMAWTFDFGRTWYSMRQAEGVERQFRADEANLVQEVTYEVTSMHLKIAEAEERIKVAQKGLEQAKEGYRMAVARYQAQVGTNTDVLDAQDNLTSAESNLTTAMADYLIAVAQMYVAMGRANPSLISNYDAPLPELEPVEVEEEAAVEDPNELSLSIQ